MLCSCAHMATFGVKGLTLMLMNGLNCVFFMVLSVVYVVCSQQSIDGLHVQIDQFESEIEGIVSKKKKLDREVSVKTTSLGFMH